MANLKPRDSLRPPRNRGVTPASITPVPTTNKGPKTTYNTIPYLGSTRVGYFVGISCLDIKNHQEGLREIEKFLETPTICRALTRSRACNGVCGFINPFRAPEPLPILNPSNFVPKNGFPVVKGLRTWENLSGTHVAGKHANESTSTTTIAKDQRHR